MPKNMITETINEYLDCAETFEDFFNLAEEAIWEHLEELNGGERINMLTNDARDYALELWNDKQEDYRLDFHCSLPAYKFDEKYNRELELKNKYK